MAGERQVNVKSQSELDIGGRETCFRVILGPEQDTLINEFYTDLTLFISIIFLGLAPPRVLKFFS